MNIPILSGDNGEKFSYFNVTNLCLTVASVVRAEILTPEARLRKMSLQMTGHVPTAADFAEVTAKAQEGDAVLNDYLTGKAKEFLRSDLGLEKMVDRGYEALRFDLNAYAPEDNRLERESFCYGSRQLMRIIFRHLLKHSESWDSFVLSAQPAALQEIQAAFYALYCSRGRGETRSMILKNHPEIRTQFESDRLPTSQAELEPVLDALFEVIDDPKIYNSLFNNAGKVPSVVSTGLFAERYNQTMYSRAAAFARTYFCNDMRPVLLNKGDQRARLANKGLKIVDDPTVAIEQNSVPSKVLRSGRFAVRVPADPNGEKGYLDSIFSYFKKSEDKINPVETKAPADPHLKPECAGCHRILNPAKDLVDGKSDVEMVYDDFEGTEHRVKISQSTDVMATVSKQPQYVRCQVRRMLDWFVGSDVIWTAAEMNDLVAKYEAGNRNYVDFVGQLVITKPYYTDEAFTRPYTIQNVQPIFNQCNSCHIGARAMVPVLANPPFDFGAFTNYELHIQHVATLGALDEALSLHKEGKGAVMPPQEAGWKLSDVQRLAVERFVYDLSRKADGTPTISETERDALFANYSPEQMNLIKDRTPRPGFADRWKSYMRNYDMVRVLGQFYPNIKNQEGCSVGGRKNDKVAKGTMGFFDSTVGAPSTSEPTDKLEEWTVKCFTGLFYADFTPVGTPEVLNKYHLDALLGPRTGNDSVSDVERAASISWSQIEPQNKQKWMNSLMDEFIGPRTMSREKRQSVIDIALGTIDEFVSSQPNKAQVSTAVFWGVFYVLSDVGFRTY